MTMANKASGSEQVQDGVEADLEKIALDERRPLFAKEVTTETQEYPGTDNTCYNSCKPC